MNKIHLDSREPKDVQEDCKKTFGKENVVVEFMLIGDLIFPKENLCIERKRIGDAVGSIMDQRIFRQAVNMTENFQNSVIIIIGSWKEIQKSRYIKFSEKQFLGACASLMTKYNMKVFWVENNRQFWLTCKYLTEKCNGDPIELETIERVKFSGDKHFDMLRILVGPKKAHLILAEHKFKDLVKLTKKDLQQIKGIGPGTAARVKEWL